MKKKFGILKYLPIIIYLLVIFAGVVDLPTLFKGYGISDYRMDVTITNEGHVEVEEAFDLNGEYNGYERYLVYDNEDLPEFNPNVLELGGNKLHNAEDLQLNSIKSINSDDIYTDDINGILFSPAYDSRSGITNTYEYYSQSNQDKIKIYNPDTTGKAFYLNYTYESMAVKHDDVSELGFNIFSEVQTESIEKMVININVPGNKDLFEVYGHGYVDAEIEIIDKENAVVTLTGIKANTPLDIRVVFDNDVLSNIDYSKITNISMYDQITVYEERIAEEQAEYNTHVFIMTLVGYILIGLLIAILPITYILFDKEFERKNEIKYLRELPNKRRPWMVSYLMNGSTNDNDIMVVLSYLVYVKVLSLVPSKTEPKEYDFVFNEEHNHKLTSEEILILNWFFKDNKQTNRININIINSIIESNPEETYKKIQKFKAIIAKQAKSENLFLSNSNKFIMLLISAILAIPYALLVTNSEVFTLKIIIIIIFAINAVYISVLKKRSINGAEEYYKWLSFKNFLIDFSKLDERNLPEIKLWEHYLVYAIALGVNEEVTKQLANIPAYQEYDNNHYPMMFYSARYSMYSRVFTSSINTANTARMQSSSGGFSGGGGSFGGGGGGGRF